MTSIKLCPFCGGKAEVYPVISDAKFGVCCQFCTARKHNYSSPDRAIAGWNGRAEPELDRLRTCIHYIIQWIRQSAVMGEDAQAVADKLAELIGDGQSDDHGEKKG